MDTRNVEKLRRFLPPPYRAVVDVLYAQDRDLCGGCGVFALRHMAGASPDGLTNDGAVLEIKTPFSCRKGKAFKPLSEQPHYELQCQFEMLASGRDACYFAQYRAPKGDPFSPDYVEEDNGSQGGWCARHIRQSLPGYASSTTSTYPNSKTQPT